MAARECGCGGWTVARFRGCHGLSADFVAVGGQRAVVSFRWFCGCGGVASSGA